MTAETVKRVSALDALKSVRHGFFTSHAQNCAYRTPDETDAVTAARARCSAILGVDSMITVKQRHTPDVVSVETGWPWNDAPIADAMVTARRGVALGILTADCAPVLFADEAAGVIGAAHAGWRGAVDGVVANTVAAMIAAGAQADRIVAAVGPCIGLTSYEVGPDFRDAFIARDAAYAAYFDTAWAKPHFDLPRFVADRVRAAGVGTVVVQGADTLADEENFFSFRRATLRKEPDYGRQISAIALAP